MRDLLKTDKRGLIISMIHKFEGIDRDANTRDNIYVFIDEAHRSVSKDLGTYMMAAVPNATIIGFTGTPIAKTAQGEGTFKIFGTEDETGYLDKYSIRESIEDETTLPIRHTMAPSEIIVPAERLDREFFELAAAEGVTDVEELNRVLDRAVGLRTFLTADDRIEKVVTFVAQITSTEKVSAVRLQGVSGWCEPGSLCQVQARTGQTAAARMVGGRLHRERGGCDRPAAGGRAAASARTRGRCPASVQETRTRILRS